MDEIDEVRSELALLREQSHALLQRALGAEAVMGAFARGEVDAVVSLDGSERPTLLVEAQEALRKNEQLLRAITLSVPWPASSVTTSPALST